MKILSRSVLFALLGCVVGLSLSSAAQAARFQEYLSSPDACIHLDICTLNFSVVPAGKTLDVTNFSCYLRTLEGAEVYAVQLLQIKAGGDIGNAVTADLQLVNYITRPFRAKVYQSNNTIFAFATAGQRFRAYAQLTRGGGFVQFACHISGQLLP
jgi:hypothetical protein